MILILYIPSFRVTFKILSVSVYVFFANSFPHYHPSPATTSPSPCPERSPTSPKAELVRSISPGAALLLTLLTTTRSLEGTASPDTLTTSYSYWKTIYCSFFVDGLPCRYHERSANVGLPRYYHVRAYGEGFLVAIMRGQRRQGCLLAMMRGQRRRGCFVAIMRGQRRRGFLITIMSQS